MTSNQRKFNDDDIIGRFFNRASLASPRLTSEEMTRLISQVEPRQDKKRVSAIPVPGRVIHLDKDGFMIIPLLEF